MTREEAIARSEELNRDPGRERQWFPREADSGEWEVVSVTAPGLPSRGPTKETVESRPRPSEPPDPRPTIFRNIPPYGAG